MKKKIIALVGFATIVAASLAFKGGDMLNIGEKAPMSDVKMKDVSGKTYSLKDLKKENGLLVVFSCNTCPFVLGWEDTYPGLGELTQENKVGMVLVNSNEAKRGNDDSFEAMKDHYKSASYNTPYVMDEKHKLADAFGAKTTPHVYLFDKDMELVYRGSIDDKYEERKENPDKTYLEDAIKAMVNGKTIDPAETRQIGCSIKRVKA
ncbi:MAG: thioredoxin family protein [Owenweeksia sp.]